MAYSDPLVYMFEKVKYKHSRPKTLYNLNMFAMLTNMNKNRKLDPLRAKKTFIRNKNGPYHGFGY